MEQEEEAGGFPFKLTGTNVTTFSSVLNFLRTRTNWGACIMPQRMKELRILKEQRTYGCGMPSYVRKYRWIRREKKNCFVNVTLRENQKIICKFSSNAQTILIKQSVPFYFKSPLKPSNACQL